MTLDEYRAIAEECIRQAIATEDERDRPLWATMARSWLLLAEHARRVNGDESGDGSMDADEPAEVAPALN